MSWLSAREDKDWKRWLTGQINTINERLDDLESRIEELQTAMI